MRIHFARHFTTPRHYIGFVAVEQRAADGDPVDDWAAYVEAMPVAVAEHGPVAVPAPSPDALAALTEQAVHWGAKLGEADARYFFPPGRFPQLAELPYRA